MWNTSSIEGMEQTAKNEASGDCNKKIRGEWLEVTYIEPNKWNYKWGMNFVSRNVAQSIIDTAND